MPEFHIFRVPLEAGEKTLVDASGTPIDPSEDEPTLESSLMEAKFNRFVANQLKIVELLQEQLLKGVENEADPERLYTLSETLRTNMRITSEAEDVYLDH